MLRLIVIDIKEILTQKFAKNTYSQTTWKDSFPFFPQKKACILLHFFIIIPFKEKAISYYPLVITAAARNRLIVIGSNETRGFYIDMYKRHGNKCKETQVAV
ncbi:MAG: hypothetical protein DYG83_11265 [Candidatus Brocadia sp. AMX2]|nr:MAG: hypothetical protein EDM70_09075 [Candidatus Brocadia sp. AMX2]MBC6933077.1 hypothetical protein [Candidatus Brocadia sp.]MBL1169038.1 hypothetical protein [Candidatus Brocadia sp. AMX1]MCE7867385.1 hypothetical protein [Candidatus Brocadia sp. AMX2]MCQ3918064.1 hypothetical protein [Candidatus Brocadia sp.]